MVHKVPAMRNRPLTVHPLKTWRQRAGLTQEALAAALGVSDMAVSRWERGGLPEKEAWQRLIDFTRGAVTPDDWFTIPAGTAATKRRNHGKST